MKNKLLPNKHKNKDIFICDLFNISIKDDMVSMEHPIFVLTKQPYMKIKKYEHNGSWFEVVPSHTGTANIWDKDILIFAISRIMGAKNAGEPYSKHISFNAYDYLVYTNKYTGGRDYRALEEGLKRLDGTRLRTNIKTGDEEQLDGFGIIDKFRIRRKNHDGRVLEWGITLSDWLFNAIEANQVLTLNPKYFRLRKPLEKRVYEIVRKHCGKKNEWRIRIDLLQKKCGSTDTKRNFKSMVKDIIEHQHLPDYKINFDEEKKNILVITSKTQNLELDLPRPELKLKTQTYESAKNILMAKRLDVYDIEAQWLDWMKDKVLPDNPDAAFIGFCKKKIYF